MKKLFILMIMVMGFNSLLNAKNLSINTIETTTKVNGILQKGAPVCRTKRGLKYLLKSDEHYQDVLNSLKSHNFYKNCFLSTSSTGVYVTAHYSSKGLIQNYYIIKHADKTRYIPVAFIKPLNKAKSVNSNVYKKRVKFHSKKKKNIKVKKRKHKKLKKYVKHKRTKIVHKSKKVHLKHKKKIVQKVKVKKIVKSIHKPEEAYNNKLKTLLSSNMTVVDEYNAQGIKVYRCSAVSFDESFTGQHVEKEKSKQIALNNCRKYQKGDAICLFESCYILRLSSK